jgi:hypothetical protein
MGISSDSAVNAARALQTQASILDGDDLFMFCASNLNKVSSAPG